MNKINELKQENEQLLRTLIECYFMSNYTNFSSNFKIIAKPIIEKYTGKDIKEVVKYNE